MEGILKNIRLFAREKEDREAMEQYGIFCGIWSFYAHKSSGSIPTST